jgi:hypothetical protein
VVRVHMEGEAREGKGRGRKDEATELISQQRGERRRRRRRSPSSWRSPSLAPAFTPSLPGENVKAQCEVGEC